MSDTKITLIVAASENNAIGKENKMLWHLPSDFKYFKQNTINHSVVMGRKTFESIGKPLVDRRNIILTRNVSYIHPEVDVANSINEVLNYCRDEREIFIIGGAEVYKQALPLADKVLLTRVHTTIQGDAYFPELSETQWKKTSAEKHEKDDKNSFDFTFEVYERI